MRRPRERAILVDRAMNWVRGKVFKGTMGGQEKIGKNVILKWDQIANQIMGGVKLRFIKDVPEAAESARKNQKVSSNWAQLSRRAKPRR